MNETKHDGHPHGDPNGGHNDANGRPYWRRAHRDWRFYVAVALMLVAMLVYVTRQGRVGVGINPSRSLAVPAEAPGQ